jgi:multimeric flavodoxin WrbA
MTIVLPENEYSAALLEQIEAAAEGIPHTVTDRLDGLTGSILFAVALDECGCNDGYYRMLRRLRGEPALLQGCTAGLVVTGQGELYTKSIARTLALSANMAGCALIGRPLVEATGSLRNFHTQADIQGVDVHTACRRSLRELMERLGAFQGPQPVRRLTAIHASVRRTSNTLSLWELVRRHLTGVEIEEFCLLNGAVSDCAGCSYTTCMHFGDQGGCFYGGVMVDEVFPALRRSDTLVMLCANYNDALSANLTAFVNRLTSLFRQQRFYDKRLYGLVVSGYSGGDLLAQQLLSAMNMNKSFYLPPYFALLETANDAGSLLRSEGIEERARQFALRMLEG